MPSWEMFSKLDMLLERDRENELSSLSTRPVANRTNRLSLRRGKGHSKDPRPRVLAGLWGATMILAKWCSKLTNETYATKKGGNGLDRETLCDT